MYIEDLPIPKEGFVVTHFLVSNDVARSTAFYGGVLGGKVVMRGEPTIVKLANIWVTINVGGGPTEDKPDVTLKTRANPNTVEMFLNIRVADIQACYAEWKSKGAEFITEPKEHDREWRCYMRDPDGYIIEVGQVKM